jgi:hypothetical protein
VTRPVLRLHDARTGRSDDLGFELELLNDAGERAAIRVWAPTANDALFFAQASAMAETGDETWAMNEWRPLS